ncbi:MAG: restriction endonuclease subunit S [Thermoleophilia bacterium]|nr:restriction endonuclease subunit S [Thermoleophilia bacterium]
MSEVMKVQGREGLCRFKPYSTYRDSGVEWMGEIPAHWEVKRLRTLGFVNPSVSELRIASPCFEVSFVPMDAIGEWGGLNLETTKQLSEVWSGYTYFCDGDVLVAKITPCFENGKGALARGLINGMGFGTTELHVIRPSSGLHADFLAYLTFSQPFRGFGQVEMKGAAGQQRVPEDFIKNFRVPLPPLPEQRAIAAFLDRETAKIDALVAKKERLIELLQEKRTALITQAVTKGLDPAVPMKDSGVEWLGEIPAHWEMKRLKYLALLNPESLGEDTDPGMEMIYVDIGGVDSFGRIVEREALTFGSAPTRARRLVRDGDVIVSTVRTYLRAIAAIRDPELNLVVSTGFAVVRPADRLTAGYAAYALRASYFVERVVADSKGASFPAINESELATYPLPVPPEAEQLVIAAFLDRETAKIDALIAKVREGIERLKEYRTALISAAVTGKIDVREEVNA